MAVWDEKQLECHRYSGSAIFSGPPGAGKTLVLYNNMLRYLHAIVPQEISNSILFVLPSNALLTAIKEEY